MANLKELRTRIASVKSTKQMTSAMKMVAASKLRKAQNAAVSLTPYADKLRNVLADLVSASDDNIDNKFLKSRKTENVLLIVISSNRGLCGGFNSSVEKEALTTIKSFESQDIKGDNLHLYCFGKKGADALRSRKYNIDLSDNKIFDNLNYEYVSPIANEILEQYASGKYDRVEIIYNQFKNAATQILCRSQLLPVVQPQATTHRTNYIYEPDEKELLEQLIPRFVTIELYQALLNSYAAEHGARMTAMHKATDNATELLKELTLNYNKARQAAITNEILEIVGGADALKN